MPFRMPPLKPRASWLTSGFSSLPGGLRRAFARLRGHAPSIIYVGGPAEPGHSITCHWMELWDAWIAGDFAERANVPGRIADGVLIIPGPVHEITFAHGLWDQLNDELGTLFDYAEEQEIPPALLPRMVALILEFSQRRYAGTRGVVQIMWGPRTQVGSKPAMLVARMPAADLVRWLGELCTFLEDAAARGKSVLFWL
jgi:hypothetical protein